MERKAFSNQLELLGGETPHTPRASLAEAQWEPLRILRAGLDPGGRAPGWGLGGGRAHPVLETAPGGVRLWSQNPGAASPSSPSEAWRRFPGPVPFQPVSILKPGDNERLVSGASVFFFFSFFSTVHAILRNSWASGGGGRRLWNLFLRVATTSFSWGGCGLDLLLPWEHTRGSLCTWSRKDRDRGGRQRKSRTGFPRPAALFIAPKMVFVQLSWTFVDVQIWELCS